MRKESSKTHDFILLNKGDAPLTVTLIQTSCKCTIADLKGKKATLLPGEKTEISLKWRAEDYSPRFAQSAQIQTNDPSREIIDLRVEGVVIQPLRPSPEKYVFSSVSASKESALGIRFFSYDYPDLKIVGHKFENESTSEFYELTTTDMESTQLRKEVGAKRGYILKLAVKPGIPIGSFQQKVIIETSAPAPDQFVTIPIEGIAKGDISIVADLPYDPDHSILRFGNISRDKTAVGTMKFIIKNAPDDIKITFDKANSIDWELLGIEIGEPKKLAKIVSIPIKVSVAKGQKPVSLIGPTQDDMIKLVFETNHATAKRIDVYVMLGISD